MTGDLSLFDAPPTAGRARAHDRGTSREAARSIRPGTESLIRGVLVAHGAMTADEICDELPGCLQATVKSAIARAGVVDSGERRPSRAGRASIVWRLA